MPSEPDENGVLAWLMDGDPSIRWQVMRDLLGSPRRAWAAERARVGEEGWGARLLAERDPEGLWGGGIYTPKWISTTYTLLLLRRMGLAAEHPLARESCGILLERGRAADGGINFWQPRFPHSETCVTGMTLSILCHFRAGGEYADTMVEHFFGEQMPDGGWNCRRRYGGATHSSFHTTVNVLEGLREYVAGGGRLAPEVEASEALAREFFLRHRLYRSHRTGEIVKPAFTRFSFPPRWHHDVLRTLDYFALAKAPLDPRLEDPVGLVRRKRRKDGLWALQNRHPGRVFFEMEPVGPPSRWNTLRAVRVLRWWDARQAD